MKKIKQFINWIARLFGQGVINAANAWPVTGAGALASGYVQSGVTTVRWGSGEFVTSVNAVAVNGTTVGIVMRATQRALAENIKLGNGMGVSITRMQIVDGQSWDITMRDDTGITGRPKIGTAVIIVDGAGHLGNVGLKYTSTVIEGGYEVAPKTPGELTFSVENCVLIESQTGS